MGPIFPACGYIVNPVITQLSATSMRVTWSGVATSYKLRYRESGLMQAWTVVTMPGTGSSGGSGYFTNPNEEQENPGSYDGTVTADFTVEDLVAGGRYDLELINVCLDGSEFTMQKYFAFTAACAAIANFRIVSEINGIVKLAWDAVGGITDYILVVSDGSEDDDEYEVTGTEYTLRDLILGKKYVFTLNYLCGTGGSVISEPLSVIGCACVDKEEDVVPAT